MNLGTGCLTKTTHSVGPSRCTGQYSPVQRPIKIGCDMLEMVTSLMSVTNASEEIRRK